MPIFHFYEVSLDTINNHILLHFRYHTIKYGAATIPYQAVASRTRSKSRENILVKERLHQYLEYLEDNLTMAEDDEFIKFLNTLTVEVPNVQITESKESTSSSGSSVLRDAQELPDCINYGSSPSSTSENLGLEGAPSLPEKENSGLSIQEDGLPLTSVVSAPESPQETVSHPGRMAMLPGFTELINTNIQVITHSVH